jgi:two-component system, sensor histidine kinase RegB
MTFATIPSGSGRSSGSVRRRTLLVIRWIAVSGQATTLLAVHYGLEYRLPIFAALAVVAASALLNLVFQLTPASRPRMSEREAAIYLGYDTLQLGALLYLTGGLGNPFALLMLAPVTVSASVLSRRSTAILTVLVTLCFAVLAVWHLPLPTSDAPIPLPQYYVVGNLLGLTVGVTFVAAYTSSVAAQARQLSDALAATQLALAREQRVSALGALAAAAAHELGSPLGTIAVIARDLARDLPQGGPEAQDAALLLSETRRCRDILAKLAQRPDQSGGSPFDRLPIAGLVETAAAPFRREGIELKIRVEPPDAAGLALPLTPEMLHGLGNLLQNALQFADTEVEVFAEVAPRKLQLRIRDDGPGFPPSLVGRLGEPYVSGRDREGDHMGLGVFIAATLLARTGAELGFANRAEGGAEVTIAWPREVLAR